MMRSIGFLSLILILSQCRSLTDPEEKVIWIKDRLDTNDKTSDNGDTIAIEYFKEHKLTRKVVLDHTADKRRIEKTYFYDNQGRDVGFLFKLENTVADKTDIYRDSFGNITASKTYQPDGGGDTVILSYLNLLDSDSLAVAAQILNVQEGSLLGTVEYKYDNNKRLVEIRHFSVKDTSRSLESVETYNYNSIGNKLLVMKEKFPDSTGSKEVNEYGSDGKQLISQQYFENDTAIYKIDYVYEKERKKEAIMSYFPTSEKYRIRFVYQ